MSDIIFALGIPHAPWLKGRPASLERLDLALSPDTYRTTRHNSDEPLVGYKVFSERAANHVWSAEMWQWAVCQPASHFLTLQDDAIVCRDFWETLLDVVRARPDDVIGLQVAHPASVPAYADRASWLTTGDAVIGVGYAMPTSLLSEFLTWRASALREGAVEAIPEDSLIGLWCACTGRKVWHPLPALVTHDTSLVSAYAHEGHTNRVSSTFEDTRAVWDTDWPFGDTSDAGFMFAHGMRKLAAEWLITPPDTTSWVENVSELRRLTHVSKAQRDAVKPRAKLFVATPMRGGVKAEYAAAVWRLVKHDGIDVTNASELVDVQMWHEDIVRCRSRFVEFFLTKTDATHLLFVDSDVSFSLDAIEGMLRAEKDFVACPYPRRDSIDFGRVIQNGTSVPVEASAYRYSVRILGGALKVSEKGLAEIDGIGLGCALLSRQMLTYMRDEYAGGLTFIDTFPGTEKKIPTTALFMLSLTGGKELLSEDYSFCARARESGYPVHLYLGPGSPVTHHGTHDYKGTVESFGIRRVTLE